jgi:hypothetical protein
MVSPKVCCVDLDEVVYGCGCSRSISYDAQLWMENMACAMGDLW